MIAILKHKIVDYIRKKVRESVSDKVESLSDTAANESVDGSFDRDGEWKDRQANAFMMREIDGLSTDEICKALGISATNSWVILYRARIKKAVKEQWP